MTKRELTQLLAVIKAVHPDRPPISDERAEQVATVWHELLGDLDYALANAATRELLQSLKWPPTIAEIRESCLLLQHGPTRAGGDAWADVLAAVSRFGYTRDPVFRDPVTARCVGALGWRELCMSENAIADRARFIDLYDKLAKDERREQQSPILRAAREQREALAGEVALRLLPRGDA